MKINKSILRETIRFSRIKNTKDAHPEYDNFSHFSFIVWNGKILGWATNKKSGCSYKHLGYPEISKTHAEYEVIRKYKNWATIAESSIINIRLNKQNHTKLSAPCKACKRFMSVNGISTVYYSIEGDNFKRIEL